jgi:hypothetical protein
MNFFEHLKQISASANQDNPEIDPYKLSHRSLKDSWFKSMTTTLSEEMKSTIQETSHGNITLEVNNQMPRHDWIDGAWVARLPGTVLYENALFEDVIVRSDRYPSNGWCLRCRRSVILTPDQACNHPAYKPTP